MFIDVIRDIFKRDPTNANDELLTKYSLEDLIKDLNPLQCKIYVFYGMCVDLCYIYYLAVFRVHKDLTKLWAIISGL